MSGSGGFAVSRAHGGDRFYNPPALRRHRQFLQQQQHLKRQQRQQLQRPVKSEAAPLEAGSRADWDDLATTLSKHRSVCSSSSSPRPQTDLTNLDRLMESVSPSVRAQYLSEVMVRECRAQESDIHPYYCLEDLWESFRESSAYGVGVPLVLNGKDSIVQYYVPFLSGIQLYVEPLKSPSRLRRPVEESDANSSRETNCGGSSDCEADRRAKSVMDGLLSQPNLMNLSSQQMNRHSLRERTLMNSSGNETGSSHGKLIFEYFEYEQPHNRKPLIDKVSALASQFPALRTCRSCDLLPASWVAVAWYPIYRIPMGPTLRDLDASFLTFHNLSTKSRSDSQLRFHGVNDRNVPGVTDRFPKVSLPVFGLASYKLKGSILTPIGPYECQQESSLLKAADSWIQRLQIVLPDYKFFHSHYVQR